MLKWFLETFWSTAERICVVCIGACVVASLVFILLACLDVATAGAQEPTATAVVTASPTPTATPTIDPEVQAARDRATLCLDSVHYHYFSRTGIELEPLYFKYAVMDSGVEITGTADADDERLTGIVNFKCVFEDLMDVPLMLTEVEVTEGE